MADTATTTPTAADARKTATTAARETRIAEYLAELDGIRVHLEPVRRLYDRRMEIYQALRNLNVPDATIAEHSGTTPESIRVAMTKARRAKKKTP
jgi:hypothetical protein